MAKIQTTKKRRLIKANEKAPEISVKPVKSEPQHQETVVAYRQKQPEPDSDSDSDHETLPQLLEPYSKEQLIDLITEAASNDPTLFRRIRDAADIDVSHRKIFVHGLGWDTTRDTLLAAFLPFGEIEDCNLVLDKNTGKTKGYGFVLFRTRRGAMKSLREPKKLISNRTASCQLASVGPGAPSSSSFNGQSQSQSLSLSQSDPAAARKVYVSGVPHEAEAEKLRSMFAKFGEIEAGPMGFDSQTGKCRGFALFLYKNVDGFKKCLEEPVKMFEGHQLNCQKAAEGSKTKNNNNALAAMPAQQQPSQPPPPMAAVTAQNMAFFGQYNPLYSGLMTNVGGALANPAMMAARPLMPFNPAMFQAGQFGQLGAGVGGFGGGGALLGAYGNIAALPGMQTLQQVYPTTQSGQSATVRPQGTNGSLTGYPPYMW